MPSSVPTPVAAALGIVPTVLGGVRRLPGRAVQLPVFAVSTALAGLDLARREYDDLAARGERLLARLRGTSFDELEDRVEDSLQGTALARPYDAVEDALEDAGEAITNVATRTAGSVADLSQKAAQRAGKARTATARVTGKATEQAGDAVHEAEDAVAQAQERVAQAAKKAGKAAPKTTGKAGKGAGKAAGTAGTGQDAVQDELPAAQQPKKAPTPKATQPDDTRISTAAPAEVVQAVEQVAGQAGADQVLEHDQLPLPDYDHMTLGSLRGRLRSLTVDQLVQLRTYEKAHADRLPVVTMLDNRIAKLASDSAEKPSGVPSDRPAPGQEQHATGSKVQPSTGGPAQNPPSAGDPTNPSQPRSSGSGGTNPA